MMHMSTTNKRTPEDILRELFDTLVRDLTDKYENMGRGAQLELISRISTILERGLVVRKKHDPENIQSIRLRANLKQEELANIIGVDQATMSRWEKTGRIPNSRSGKAYAKWLDEHRHSLPSGTG